MFFEKSLRLKYIILILQLKIIRLSYFSPKALPLKQKIRLASTSRTFIYLNKSSSDEEKTGKKFVKKKLLPRTLTSSEKPQTEKSHGGYERSWA